MGRWEPDAAGRLVEAALELFAEHAYEQTTVADIAQKAGVTERTFFRYYADKREVLFAGANLLEEGIVASIAAAPPEEPPFDAVVAAIASTAGTALESRREFARRRASVIASNASLQERELLKLAALGAAASAALRDRGATGEEAELAAEAGVALFKIGFERWIASPDSPSIADCVQAAARGLRTVVAAKEIGAKETGAKTTAARGIES
ncbi:TetR family transcriptional regulator [Sinomonas terrae]|uniref:TetR family transcriptional regulator n=1 Tax=Sinomonas terrae TaxID=2908838 RepID=A0ABS9U3F2_9MICC|nr:TetR family transcriptional regulator [Sinomonas terrae]MCH6471032.1 TetR family transcriptional regulator [Sinomonas terrae]